MDRQIRDKLHLLVVLSACQLAAVGVWVGYSIASHESEKSEAMRMLGQFYKQLDASQRAAAEMMVPHPVKAPPPVKRSR